MAGFGLSLEEQERVWELRRSGLSLWAVARALGQPPQRVVRYVASTGGRRPVARKRAERCLSAAEREEISRGLAGGLSSRQIAAAIARSHSTVSREVARNATFVISLATLGRRARSPHAASATAAR